MGFIKAEEPQKQPSRFRAVLAQVIAAIVSNLIAMDYSMMLAFPTVLIGALYNIEGPLTLDDAQASWLGSLVYVFQPIGSTMSGIITESLGRKLTLIFVNILPLTGWLLMYFAESVPMLYLANATMGLGIGFMEAPLLTYVGEISESSIRGILTAFAGTMVQMGFLAAYLLGATMHWRTVSIVSAAVPIVSALLIMLIPESPMWLLSRDRTKDAQNALCWLRGWVEPAAVQAELQELASYAESTKQLLILRASNDNTLSDTDKPSKWVDEEDCEKVTGWSLVDRLRDLMRPDTYRPLLLVIAYFFFYHTAGISGVRPYMVHVIDEFRMPIDTHWAAVMTALLGIVAISFLTAMISYCGRRPLAVVSIAGCAVSCIVLGTYAFVVIAPGYEPETEQPATWLPLTMFVMLSFFTYFGIGQLSWMYISELFPLRSRGMASGLAVAIAYVLYFMAAKTYLYLESSLKLHGVFWLYGACSCLGIAFIYFVVPETEGKTLEEVEALFKSHKCNKGSETVMAASTASMDTIITLSSNEVVQVTGNGDDLSVAIAFALYFMAAKTYLYLESSLKLHGVFWLYGACSCLGIAFIYFVVPETEGKTLEEVEALFKSHKCNKASETVMAASTASMDTIITLSSNEVVQVCDVAQG